MNFRLLNRFLIVLIIISVVMMTSCKDFGNNSPQESKTLRVDISQLQSQMGIAASGNNVSNSISAPGDTPATIPIKGLVVGIIKLTERSTPYSLREALTDDVMDDLKADITNSAEFIEPIGLPVDTNYVEFKLPPPTAGNWQVLAVGLDFKINTIGEIGEDAHKDSAEFFGFSDKEYNTDDYNGETVTFRMIRNCWSNDTSRGCAAFKSKLDEKPVVTSAVEIVGVRYNGKSTDFTGTNCLSGSFPKQVATTSEADEAISLLTGCRDAIIATGDPINILTTRVAHKKNYIYENSACQALDASADVNAFDTNCKVENIDVYIQ